MSPDEKIAQLEAQLADLTAKFNHVWRPDSHVFEASVLGGTQGFKLVAATGKLGFFAAAPIVKWTSGTGRQDLSGNTGLAANVGFQVNGNSGTTYYSLGDVVAALKTYGLLAS